MKTLKYLATLTAMLVLAIPASASAAVDKAVAVGVDASNSIAFVTYLDNGTSVLDTNVPINLTGVYTNAQFTDVVGDAILARAALQGYTGLTTKSQIIWPGADGAPVQANWSETSTSSLAYIQNKPSILPLSYYHNGSVQSGAKLVTFSGTTSSGTATFHLTTDGTSGGTAICSGAPQHVNVIANDPNNTFGLGWSLSNSNKTLTVTANVRSFTNTTILGITVLGGSSVGAAANGTPINVSVVCN